MSDRTIVPITHVQKATDEVSLAVNLDRVTVEPALTSAIVQR
jgi:hypothetical protein